MRSSFRVLQQFKNEAFVLCPKRCAQEVEKKMAIARITRISGAITLLITIFSLSLPAYAKYGGGIGEPNDPYLIYTAEQMNAIGTEPNDWGRYFKLMVDIDLAAYENSDFNIIGSLTSPFTGVFDGNNHTISNFNYTSSKIHYLGLFGRIHGPHTVIKTLGLKNCNVEAGEGNWVGVLVGSLGEGRVTECFADGGSVGGRYHVGGLVGYNSNGMILNSHSNITVNGFRNVGGLVGEHFRTVH